MERAACEGRCREERSWIVPGEREGRDHGGVAAARERTRGDGRELKDENHKKELEKVVETCRAEMSNESLRDVLQETNFYSRQKEYNVMAIAYQKMEEFLMNRIRQLTNMVNRSNTLVTESLQANEAMSIPDGVVTMVTKAQLMEMKKTLPVVNMNYLKEVVVKSV